MRISDSFKIRMAAERPETMQPLFTFKGNANLTVIKLFEGNILPTVEQPETIKPLFTFKGNADLSVIKLFERNILPTRVAMFFNICSIPIFFLSFIYFRIGMYFLSIFVLFLAGVLFLRKYKSKKKIMNYLLSIISQLFENGPEHTFCPNYVIGFFDEYIAVIREDGIEIQIIYTHLNRVSEKDSYIALITKDPLVFPFHDEFISPMHKNTWLKFIRKKAPHMEFLHIE